ncbi:AAA family ATPase [Nocardia sp. alder85J]|uniref:AAA family ATPase n=1 Tax=Nocardia sp. alder85J TaxID=2862949 RepID=UPI001CD488FA|nr:AAA family ATPase [Nocardia sp. alder85J]MCX4099164.1 AAA family ATPase [Nocardia sp. alder85J]
MTGHAAFARREGESLVTQFVRIGAEPVPDLRADGVPDTLCAAIEAAMEQQPADRPASARTFAARLRNIQFASGLPVDALVSDLPAEPAAARAAGTTAKRSRGHRALVATPATRFRPPTSSHRLVHRPRLLETLREGRSRRLVLIHAPPGYGKSTLAAQWAAELAAEDIQVAWLSLVPDDNNLTWYLTRLVEAVRRIQPRLAGELAQILEDGSCDAARYVLTTLIDEIHAGDRTVAVVIDDWHRIHSREVREAMRFLLDNACHHLRLVVTSRTSTGLPLAGLRVRDELVEIDETALRFDNVEAERLLLDIGGLALDHTDIDHLRDTAEGWVAALQLASLSVRGKTDLAEHIDRISGHHHAIGDYLMENVADDLDPELLDFLMRTAVTDTTCAGLAGALTGRRDAQDLLEDIRRRDLFLRSTDDDLRWFRYHSLFADFLRHRLTRARPGLTTELHATAATWYAEHDMLTEAVDHALAAGDPERALHLIVDHADTYLADCRMASFLALAAKLPPALADSDPQLQLSMAWAQLPTLGTEAVTAACRRIDAVLAARPPDDTTANIGFETEFVRVGLETLSDRAADPSPAALAWLRQPTRPFVAAVGAAAAGMSALYRFDFAEAGRWRDWGAPYRASGSQFHIVCLDIIAAMAAFEQLDVEAAETILRGALDLALESGFRPHATRFVVSVKLAELLYHTGQFAEADELLPNCPDIDTAIVEDLMAAYGTAARLAAVHGDRSAAEQLLNQGHRVAHEHSMPRLSARMLDERIRLGLPITHDEQHRLGQLDPYHRRPDHITANATELAQDSAIRTLLAERTPAATARAIERAARMYEEIGRQQRPRALLQAQLLYGCCLISGGRTAEAIEQMVPALCRCAELGLARFAIDSSGPAIAPVLETLHGAPEGPGIPPRRFLRRLLNNLESTEKALR